jgi:hypothetical protein
LKWRFDNGYCETEEFEEKMTFLRSRLADLAKPRPVTIVLTGLVHTWAKGDNAVRLALLRNMFSELVISDGRIVDWKARPEVADELDELLAGFRWADFSRGLEGIRTRDLRLERPASWSTRRTGRSQSRNYC